MIEVDPQEFVQKADALVSFSMNNAVSRIFLWGDNRIFRTPASLKEAEEINDVCFREFGNAVNPLRK